VPYVSLYQSICDKGDCRVYADDAQQIPLFVDDDHFSREGALAIMHTVMQRGGLDDLPK
jgi:hypothetical protein